MFLNCVSQYLNLFGAVVGLIISVNAISSPDAPTYRAGVVEYEKILNPEGPKTELDSNLERYLKLISSEDAKNLDILVFPEFTLNNRETAIFVPDAEDKITPCGNADFDSVLRQLSCASVQARTYLVINVIERSTCPDRQQLRFNDSRPCPADKIIRYNTNVVFDRQGKIISKYRKYNLFGEEGITHPLQPESVPFVTDFGVTFGQFICFDLMFERPAVELVRQGITDFVFPTMWFSEMPFLTATQTQQGWAYKNQVNLLAAQSSNPSVGSTGSGIYHGKDGALVLTMNDIPTTKILVAKVPKMKNKKLTEPLSLEPQKRISSFDMLKLKLKRDQLELFNTSLIERQPKGYSQELCSHQFCCHFTIEFDVLEATDDKITHYLYRLAALNRVRTFDGHADGGVKVCAVIACTDDTLASCGTRHSVPTTEFIRFKHIKLSVENDPKENVLFMPSTLDTRILPLTSKEFDYDEIQEGDKNKIQLSLLTPKSDLLTFAIYGRKFVT